MPKLAGLLVAAAIGLSATSARGQGAYAAVNGLKMCYETRGSGQPLVLLHSGLGSGDTFGPLLPALSEGRRVLTVDLQAHGRTADIDWPPVLEISGLP